MCLKLVYVAEFQTTEQKCIKAEEQTSFKLFKDIFLKLI